MRARAFFDLTRIGSETHRPALVFHRPLIVHKIDDGSGPLRKEFRTIGLRNARHVASELDDRALHPETEPQEWHLPLSRMTNGGDLPFDPAIAKPSRHDDPIHIC